MRKKVWLVGAGFLNIFGFQALAVEAPVRADAYVVSTGNTASNTGNSDVLSVGGSNSSVSYLAFDLSVLPNGTIGTKVARANLLLWMGKASVAGAIDILPVTAPWHELELTYANSRNTLGGVFATVPVAGYSQFVVVDVTDIVKSWIDYPNQNFGLAIAASGKYPLTTVFFDSKENIGTSHAARLDITLLSDNMPGEVGPMGPSGPKGDTGATGPAGPVGPIGPMGPLGYTGATGPKGDQGVMGPKGDKGDPGVMSIPVVAENGTCNSDSDVVGITADRKKLLTCQARTWRPTSAIDLQSEYYSPCTKSTGGTFIGTLIHVKMMCSVDGSNTHWETSVAQSGYQFGSGQWSDYCTGPLVPFNATSPGLGSFVEKRSCLANGQISTTYLPFTYQGQPGTPTGPVKVTW